MANHVFEVISGSELVEAKHQPDKVPQAGAKTKPTQTMVMQNQLL
jgi:hypothetical protein